MVQIALVTPLAAISTRREADEKGDMEVGGSNAKGDSGKESDVSNRGS